MATVTRKVLEVLGETPVSSEPGEGALDHPTARQNDEAPHVVAPLDDLHAQPRRLCRRSFNLPRVVVAVGPEESEPGEAPVDLVEDQSGSSRSWIAAEWKWKHSRGTGGRRRGQGRGDHPDAVLRLDRCPRGGFLSNTGAARPSGPIEPMRPFPWFQHSLPAGVPGAAKRRLPPAWEETGRGAGPEFLVPSGSWPRIRTRAPRHGSEGWLPLAGGGR